MTIPSEIKTRVTSVNIFGHHHLCYRLNTTYSLQHSKQHAHKLKEEIMMMFALFRRTENNLSTISFRRRLSASSDKEH